MARGLLLALSASDTVYTSAVQYVVKDSTHPNSFLQERKLMERTDTMDKRNPELTLPGQISVSWGVLAGKMSFIQI
jgi:hypothetical protein